MNKNEFTALFFDWNGTLVDDCHLCHDLLNVALKSCGHEPITYERYLDIFTFPIIEYYRRAGFRFPPEGTDDFPTLAALFRERYEAAFPSLSLYPDVLPFLEEAKKHFPLYMLSATPTDLLHWETDQKGISSYFKERIGIGDIYGTSKVAAGRAYIEKSKLDPSKILFIGDTLHDEEVALSLGGKVALVAKGHQSYKVLSEGKKPESLLFPSLEALAKALF